MTALRTIVATVVLALLGHANLHLRECQCGCGDLYRSEQ